MPHVVRQAQRPFEVAEGRLEIHQVPSATDNLIWLMRCVETDEVAAVDGPNASDVLALCEERGWNWTTILNTHTHGDHVGLNRDLENRGLLSRFRVIGPAKVASDVPGLNEPVHDGDLVEFGGVKGRVILTEGHLNGHVSYLFGEALFCGDTLFGGGCGYLFDGPPSTMFQSLLTLANLPGETLVCCAHEYTEDNLRFAWSVEPDNDALAERIRRVWAIRARGESSLPSTIDEERATNPFLRPGSPSIQAAVKHSSGGSSFPTLAEWFAATRALKDSRAYKSLDDAVLPLEGQ